MLILAIFAVALLTTLAVAIASVVRVELLSAHGSLQRAQELYLAQAGIAVARSILLYEDTTFDALDDVWGPYHERPLDEPRKLANGSYRVRVYDAAGRININAADAAFVMNSLAQLTGDGQLAQEIVRWRSAREEDPYYESLDYPYQPRGGPFHSVGELLLVQGMTPELYFGSEGMPGLADLVTVESVSPNTDMNGDLRFYVRDGTSSMERTDWEQWFTGTWGVLLEMADVTIWKRIFMHGLSYPQGTYPSLSQLALVLESYGALPAIDYICTTPGPELAGLVNLNTAPIEVLAALPGSSPGLAEAIVTRREAQPFVSLGEVAEFLVLQENGMQGLTQMIDYVTTKSASFIIESAGITETNRSSRTIRALVRRTRRDVHVVQQFEYDRPLPPWGESLQMVARR